MRLFLDAVICAPIISNSNGNFYNQNILNNTYCLAQTQF